MPGCLSYVVAADSADPNLIWVTETWDSAPSHQVSMAIPPVKDAIQRAMPLIAGFGSVATTQPYAPDAAGTDDDRSGSQVATPTIRACG